MTYYFSPVVLDKNTNEKHTKDIGTFAREIHYGNLKKAISNYIKQWKGKNYMHGNEIIGISIEYCIRKFDAPQHVNTVYF